MTSHWPTDLPYDTLNTPEAPSPAASEPSLMPCLKDAKWEGREGTVCRALWEKTSSPYMPWLAVGYDHPHTFEFINTDRLAEWHTTEQTLEAQALANLRARPASWEAVDVDVKGRTLHMLGCSGDYFAAEHVLDPPFMQQAQRRLKTRGLFVGIPRRGMLLVTSGEQDEEMVVAFGAAVAGQFSRGETAVISPMLLAVKDGVIVGILETIAEAVVPDGEPTGAPEDEQEDEPGSPYISAIVSRNDRGTDDVHLMAGGEDGERLAEAVESGFMSLLKKHMLREAFSGHIQIVVLGMTPPAARRQIPKLVEHLRGICKELSGEGGRRYRVTVAFQDAAFQPTSNAPARVTSRAPRASGVAAEPPKQRSAWMRPTRWVWVLAGAALTYVAVNQRSEQAYPEAIDYGSAHLSQSTEWKRGGISAAVYVPAGEALPDASLQVGVIVSTEHATAGDLLMWIRDESLRSGSLRYHDAGTGSETCVVGVSTGPAGHRTYVALQACKAGESRAACIESDRPLDEEVFASCLNAACFDDVCNRRWLDERENMDLLLARFLDR